MRQRVLVLVVAFHAESTLAAVLDRIPGSVFEQFDCEVLVVDDASDDRTFDVGRSWAGSHPEVPVTVLANRVNQGYGGNQKVGYAYAAANGFDLVAMVHGDGQYAPEELPALLQVLVDDRRAGVVFGSRMAVAGAARAGGMPAYKWVGNRILTFVQNALLRTRLSEFHSGYRIYRVAALEQTHYRLNTNDFHFDTEILLELLSAGWTIRERPIPTYYGDEISRVNGLAYAWQVVKVTLQFTLHRLGLRQQARFDPVGAGSPYREKLGFASSHQWAVDAVPAGSRVLDVGGGPGHVTEALVAKGCTVTCVDHVLPRELPDGVEVVVADLDTDQPWPFDPASYDVILLLDVIEHLRRPEAFLARLRSHMTHRPVRVVVSTGNVAFAGTRLSLLAGQFNYGASGILDRDHTRLFTFRTLRHLLRDAGMRTVRTRGVPAPFPLAIGDNAIARALLKANLAAIRVWRSMFSFQIFVEADTTPDLDYLVTDAHTHTTERSSTA